MKPWKKESHVNTAQFIVSSVPFAGPSRTLDDLLAYAEKHASVSMNRMGRLAPSLFIIGSDGPQVLNPSSLADDTAKDGFVLVARVLCIAKSATAAVFASEAWAAAAKPGQSVDTNQRPSQAPDRQEIVILMGEERAALRQKFLPILRSPTGRFAGFGEPVVPQLDSVQGRFARFLEPAMPSAQDCAAAEAFLRSLSVGTGPGHTAFHTPRYRM